MGEGDGEGGEEARGGRAEHRGAVSRVYIRVQPAKNRTSGTVRTRRKTPKHETSRNFVP